MPLLHGITVGAIDPFIPVIKEPKIAFQIRDTPAPVSALIVFRPVRNKEHERFVARRIARVHQCFQCFDNVPAHVPEAGRAALHLHRKPADPAPVESTGKALQTRAEFLPESIHAMFDGWSAGFDATCASAGLIGGMRECDANLIHARCLCVWSQHGVPQRPSRVWIYVKDTCPGRNRCARRVPSAPSAHAASLTRAARRARTACASDSSTASELSQPMQPSVMLCP